MLVGISVEELCAVTPSEMLKLEAAPKLVELPTTNDVLEPVERLIVFVNPGAGASAVIVPSCTDT